MKSKFLDSPIPQLVDMKEAVPVFPWKLKLGWDREQGLVEVLQHRLHHVRIRTLVVDVVIKANKFPVNAKKIKN